MSWPNIRFFSLGFFETVFLYAFHLFLLFLLTPCLVVAVQPSMDWIPFFFFKRHELELHKLINSAVVFGRNDRWSSISTYNCFRQVQHMTRQKCIRGIRGWESYGNQNRYYVYLYVVFVEINGKIVTGEPLINFTDPLKVACVVNIKLVSADW